MTYDSSDTSRWMWYVDSSPYKKVFVSKFLYKNFEGNFGSICCAYEWRARGPAVGHKKYVCTIDFNFITHYSLGVAHRLLLGIKKSPLSSLSFTSQSPTRDGSAQHTTSQPNCTTVPYTVSSYHILLLLSMGYHSV